MQAITNPFASIINGPKQFVIPVFQRDYAWGAEQCDRMWSDVLRAAHDDSPHFLGSFVYVDEQVGAAFGSWLVIDGQQRLTTLTLLMVALRDHLVEIQWQGSGLSVEQIDDFFLKNNYQSGDNRYRLALRRRDNDTLKALVDGKNPAEGHDSSEAVMAAYERFRAVLRNSGVDPMDVYNGVYRLVVVDVRLERPADNPQVIFESLNSTGVDLAQSDLIRNYLLMGLNSDQQTALYDDYWSKLEDAFRDAGGGFEEFLRDYMALSERSTTQTRADRVYAKFKEFWPAGGFDEAGELLADMLKMGRYYARFLRPSMCPDKNLAAALSSARYGGFGTTHATLVARLYDLRERGLVKDGDFAEAMTLLKSYLVRRAVLGLQTGSYWNVFQRVAHAVEEDAAFETFKVALVRERGTYAFPSDESFLAGIQERDLYHLRGCHHILATLENHGQTEPSPTGDYSIEHVMPQGIANVKEWQKMLGEGWEEVHRTWLHRLGNLTLVGYDKNSAMSNRPFCKKLCDPKGFKFTAVRLNHYIREQDQWTVYEMRARGVQLAQSAVGIWPFPQADMGMVRNKNVAELQARSAVRDSSSLTMSDSVRGLLEHLEEAIATLGESIPVIENRSVCFYDGSGVFFAEMLAMAYYVRLLIPLSFDEVTDDPDELAADATNWSWLSNVTHRDCGVVVDIRQMKQTDAVLRMVRPVYEGSEA